ncbi:hypothetical protein DFH06DRAFT_1139063 [Mycena polygramma]|nr:hypothetical protein DFH06DRAFT_1139063 [Mycena polygramma]
MPKAEILHSATYWQEVRRHAKVRRDRAAARANLLAEGGAFPDDVAAAAHVYTFVPGSATPKTSVVQGNGSLLTIAPAGPSNGLRQPWAAKIKRPARDLDRLQAEKDAELLARFKAPRKQGTRKILQDQDVVLLTHHKVSKKKGLGRRECVAHHKVCKREKKTKCIVRLRLRDKALLNEHTLAVIPNSKHTDTLLPSRGTISLSGAKLFYGGQDEDTGAWGEADDEVQVPQNQVPAKRDLRTSEKEWRWEEKKRTENLADTRQTSVERGTSKRENEGGRKEGLPIKNNATGERKRDGGISDAMIDVSCGGIGLAFRNLGGFQTGGQLVVNGVFSLTSRSSSQPADLFHPPLKSSYSGDGGATVGSDGSEMSGPGIALSEGSSGSADEDDAGDAPQNWAEAAAQELLEGGDAEDDASDPEGGAGGDWEAASPGHDDDTRWWWWWWWWMRQSDGRQGGGSLGIGGISSRNMTRKSTGKSAGRSSTFSGEKEAWLDGFRDDVEAANKNTIGDVYTLVTARWFERYGFDLAYGKNVEGNPDDNPPIPPPYPMLEDEKKRRAEMKKKFRTKIGQWYRNRYKGKRLHTAAIRRILGTMRALAGPGQRPRRQPAIALYSKRNYLTKIKPAFDKVWAESKGTLPKAARVSLSRDYVQKCYDAEKEEVREAFEAEADETQRLKLEEWKAGRTVADTTAEEYHEAMESLSDVAIPMADALSERLGAHVVILIVGPIPSAQGEVSLRTIFSDVDGRGTSKTWAQHDRKGFSAMETSITRYGRALYNKEECRARAWPPLPADELVPMGAPAPPAPPPLPLALRGLIPLEGIVPLNGTVVPAPAAPSVVGGTDDGGGAGAMEVDSSLSGMGGVKCKMCFA